MKIVDVTWPQNIVKLCFHIRTKVNNSDTQILVFISCSVQNCVEDNKNNKQNNVFIC